MSAEAQVQPHAGGESFIRFALTDRIQHALLIVSFTTLAITGLIQRFNQVSLANSLILGLGGITTVRFIHRTFALMLVLLSLYHVANLLYKTVVKRPRPTMLPTPRDVVDAWQMILYFIGKRKERPLFDRYDFRAKLEYWALVWGTLVMGITGFMMWFPIQTTTFFPGEVIPAAKAAHGAEAILAVLSVIIWHMYGAHLNAEVFPMDTTMFTGKISKARLLHEHPLEYARMMEQATPAAVAPDSGKAAQPGEEDKAQK
jgi:formate dehydrogenase subunit gamma